jgi:Fic family protein
MSRGSILSEAILRHVRAEFLEMPGLKLTLAQAQRLWGVDRETCEAVIEKLTACRFLATTRDGAFVMRAAMV